MVSNPCKSDFPPWGYMVVDLHLRPASIAAALKQARASNFVRVFQKVGGATDDAFRSQSRVEGKLSPALANISRQLSHVASTLNSNYRPQVFSFMHSRRGGEVQEPHQDFTPANLIAVDEAYPGSLPASALIALQARTKLKLFDGCFDVLDDTRASVVHIPVEYCILFRDDLLHCGMNYTRANFRLHCYLQLDAISWVPDIITAASSVVYVCQYCGKTGTSSSTMRSHRHYCLENEDGASNRAKRRSRQNKKGVFKCSVCKKTKEFTAASSLRNHVRLTHPPQ